MKHTVSIIIVAIAVFIGGSLLGAQMFGISSTTYLVSPFFWIGLTSVTLYNIVRNQWPRQGRMIGNRINEIVTWFVPLALFTIGLFLIFVSNSNIWENNPPWDTGALGAGVSIVSLAFALLISFRALTPERRNLPPREPITTQATEISVFSWDAFMKEIHNVHPYIFWGTISTLILFLIFLLLQLLLPTVMIMGSQWLLFSLFPLLVALIIGGYIKVFKGFGFELEITEQQINILDVKLDGVVDVSYTLSKDSVLKLKELSPNQKLNISRLRFIYRRADYYQSSAISRYLRELPNLRYIEILNLDGSTSCFLPISTIGCHGRLSSPETKQFLEALREENIIRTYGHEAITIRFSIDDKLSYVLETLKKQRAEAGLVVGLNEVIGVVTNREIEKHIANAVLEEVRRKSASKFFDPRHP